MRAKRLELGVSFQTLAERLGVHASTLRKWEKGSILDCHGQNMMRVRRYLRGEYDQAVAEAVCIPNRAECPGVPQEFRQLMKRVAELYGLCRHYPGLGERMVGAFAEMYRRMVRELHEASLLQLKR